MLIKLGKLLLSILLLVCAIAFGLLLPQVMAETQTMQTLETFPVQAVNLDYSVERTTAERLQMILNGYSDAYEIPNGKFLTKSAVVDICKSLSKMIYPNSSLVQMLTADPYLSIYDENISDIIWHCTVLTDYATIQYRIDDATGAVLQMEIGSEDGQLLNRKSDRGGYADDEKEESLQELQEDVAWLLENLAGILQENLGYTAVEIPNLGYFDLGSSDFLCEFVFYDVENDLYIHVPVCLTSRFYLTFNL